MVGAFKKSYVAAVALLIALQVALSLVACAPSGAGAALKVGVLDNVAGMSSYSKDNQKFYGLEVELAEELATQMGYSGVDFVTVAVGEREDALIQGEVDAIVACLAETEERDAKFDFSTPYYTDEMTVVVEKSSLIKTLTDLEGTTIGTLSGSNTASLLADYLKSKGLSTGAAISGAIDEGAAEFDTWKLQEFETADELFDALESGEIDAVATDTSIANNYLSDERTKIEGFNGPSQEYSVATLKDSALSEKVEAALQKLIENGTLDALVQKWA